MKILFIAYNHKDKVITRCIYQILSEENWEDVEIFMDEFSIQPGEDIKEKCLSKAKTAALGLVILSEYTQKSEYVPQEVGILLARDIPKIYVALHENWQIPLGYEKMIKSFPLHEWQNPFEGMKKLAELVESTLKPKERKIGARELVNRAVKLGNQGNFEKALDYIEKALLVDPNYDRAHINKINNLRRLGRYDEALEAADKALDKIPGHPDILGIKGFVLFTMERYDEAIHYFEKVLEITDRSYQKPMYYLGECYAAINDVNTAMKIYNECYKLDPTSRWGRFSLQKIGLLKQKCKGEV